MRAFIYKQEKNPMQSGRNNEKNWILEYEIETARYPENIMGWNSSKDTLNQVKLKFSSKSAAIMFAENNQLQYTVNTPHKRRVVPKNYMDNFKYIPLD